MTKKHVILAIIVITAFSIPLRAEQPPVQQWAARYNGSTNQEDKATAIALDGSGNIYVTGYRTDFSTGKDFATIKYSADGNQLWVAYYNSGGAMDFANDITVDIAGNVYVAGIPYQLAGPDVCAIIKYDPNGSQLWAVCNSEPGGDRIALDAAGNIYTTHSGISKYDPNGNLLWSVPDHNIIPDSATLLALDNSGNACVAGKCDSNYATIKYDTNGSRLWMAIYNGTGNSLDTPHALAVDGTGNVYVTGESPGDGTGLDYATIKYDPNGNQLWVARYDCNDLGMPGDNYGRDVTVDNLGNVYVTGGESVHPDGYATVKYDSNGNQLWVAKYNNMANSYNSVLKITLDSNGNIYATGKSEGLGTHSDYAIVKYDSNGNQLWVTTYNGSGNDTDEPKDLAVDNAGNVYVTGSSTGSGTGTDYATIKYTQHGVCLGQIQGDLNGDCKVDFEDFAVFTSNWLNCNYALSEDCW